MSTFSKLLKRNIKIFFKDKGVFFTSLITPLILLVLYATFLGKVYEESYVSILSAFSDVVPDKKIINGLVGGQLFSSLLAVSCVTVSFCSNMILVQDKVTGARKDLLISPVKKSVLALSYYTASLISTLIVCFVAYGICLIYIGVMGWYYTFGDLLLILADTVLLVLFGTALSSVVNYFLSTQGQISAVGSIVSSCYGFICGAYMPISNFSPTLQKILTFLPGTYGTSLLRNHALNGAIGQLSASGYSEEAVNAIKDIVDCNLYFFDSKVSVGVMYAVLLITVSVLIGVYVLLNVVDKNKRN